MARPKKTTRTKALSQRPILGNGDKPKGGKPVAVLVGFGKEETAMEMAMSKDGWEVVCFKRDKEARDWVEQGMAEIIALRVPGPPGRGIGAMRRLSEAAPRAKRIILLDHPDFETAARYVNEAGADYILGGSPDAARLVAATQQLRVGAAPGRTPIPLQDAWEKAPQEIRDYKLKMESQLRARNLELSKANRELRQALDSIEEKNKGLILLNQSLKIQSTTDPLTGLFNRREFMARIKSEWARSNRYGRPLSLVMLDIDHFKKVNDTNGHECGDRVLQTLGELIQRNKRAQDVTCRYGGEEFIVMLPETSLESAFHVAEGLRRLVGHHTFRYRGQRISIHVSMGVAGLAEHKPNNVDRFINMADTAMYRAKKDGRNRTVIIDPAHPDEILHQSEAGATG